MTKTVSVRDPIPRGTRSARGIHFVKPRVVVEVEFRRWGTEGIVQQGAYKGTRIDKKASDVVREG